MRLNERQLAEFEVEGYLFLPGVFDAAEIGVLTGELPGIFAQEREEVWREKDGTAVRTAFAAHTYNEAFGRLGRHPRLVEPVRQLLDGPVYMCPVTPIIEKAFGSVMKSAPRVLSLTSAESPSAKINGKTTSPAMNAMIKSAPPITSDSFGRCCWGER